MAGLGVGDPAHRARASSSRSSCPPAPSPTSKRCRTSSPCVTVGCPTSTLTLDTAEIILRAADGELVNDLGLRRDPARDRQLRQSAGPPALHGRAHRRLLGIRRRRQRARPDTSSWRSHDLRDPQAADRAELPGDATQCSPVELNDTDVDRMITRILEMAVKRGRGPQAPASTPATTSSYLDRLQASPYLEGFDGERGPRRPRRLGPVVQSSRKSASGLRRDACRWVTCAR